jgi:hypothetical protein
MSRAPAANAGGRSAARLPFVGRIGNPSYTIACSIRSQSLQLPARQGMLV